MASLTEILNPIELVMRLLGFLEQGGNVLTVIMLATFILWLLILERYYYFMVVYKALCKNIVAYWWKRKDRQSWYAEKIRLQLLSLVSIKSEHNLASIKLLVMMAPLLGLLGTVTGMIDVFDVMAATGSSNVRGMSAGVSKATIPTMAGMTVSLSGMLFSVNLQKHAQLSIERISRQLALEVADEKT